MTKENAWWDEKHLSEMSRSEWEQICDHCGKCCLHKLEDETDNTVYYTDIACYLVNKDSCYCGDYENRRTLVPECVQLSVDNLDQINWMPPSCSYRLLKQGQALPSWHHLITGDKESIHRCGKSIKARYVSETEVEEDEFEEHVVEWPLN